MKLVFKFLLKNKELLLVFFLFLILSAPFLTDICTGYMSYLSFDKQEFLLWNFAAHKNLLPDKDILYPYGLLYYFRNYNIALTFFYYLISPFIFAAIYFIFNKIFSIKYFTYVSICALYLFVLFFTGFETFSRYGILTSFSLILGYFLYKQKTVSPNFIFLIGALLAILFSVIIDQGVYLIFSFFCLFIINDLLKTERNSYFSLNHLKKLFKHLIYLATGFLIGLIPFLIYLTYNNFFTGFVNYFIEMRNLGIVSKTPFFSFIASPANIFTFFTVYSSMFYLLTDTVLLKNKIKPSSFLQICLILNILILEQKSIMRSIDSQITFVSLILLFFVIYESLRLIRFNDFYKKIYFIFLTSVVIILSFIIFSHRSINISRIINAYNLSVNNKCFNYNLETFLSGNLEYREIINFLKKQPNFNNKIFSFTTGDSVFYILLGQKPPFYNAIFGGSSATGQESMIKYVKDNKIEYVILDTRISLIADGVPDFIREPILFKYLVNNYYPFDKIGNHLLLKKDNQDDFFNSKALDDVPEYKGYLMNVYLNKIPFSEGLYKGNKITGKEILKLKIKNNTHSFDNLNIFSKNKIMVLIPSRDSQKNYLNSINIQSSTRESLNIYFNPCVKNKMCIINLTNLPYFYKDRIIKDIRVDDKFEGELLIFENNISSGLW